MRQISECTVCYWLTDWCEKAGANSDRIYFNIDHDKCIINIYTHLPGLLIGPKGNYFNYAEIELGIICSKQKIKNYKINIVEVQCANTWVNYIPIIEDF